MIGTLTYDENGNLVARAHLYAAGDLWEQMEEQPILVRLTVEYMTEEIARVFGTADVNPWETGEEDDDARYELITTFANRVADVIHRRTTLVVVSGMHESMKMACEPGGSQSEPPSFRMSTGLVNMR